MLELAFTFVSAFCLAAAPLLAAAPPSAGGSVQNYCQASPNSVGPGAEIHWSGAVTIQDGTLVVDGLPRNVGGFFIYGNGAQQTPFGNGYSCFAGPQWILARKHATNTGTVVLDLNVEGEQEDLRWIQHGMLAGSPWSIQYLYRDEAAGGSQFNLTDALLVQF